MQIRIIEQVFIVGIFIFGIILSGCNKTPVNTEQNTNGNRNIEATTDLTDNSAANNTNSIVANQASKVETKAQISATPDNGQRQKIIDKYIAGVAKVSDAEEYKEARKIFDGDLDGDGDEDTAVQFTIEGMGGGNNYGFYLAVFRNENGNFSAVTDEVIGGKLRRDITFTKIENGRMYFDTKDYAANDGACCPSIEGKTVYILENNKLKEVRATGKNK